MAVSSGMKCVKFLIFIFNLLFFLVGLALVIAGALVQTKFRSYFAFFGDQTGQLNVNVAAILLISIGVVIFVVAFFGCLGAYLENYCLLMAFSVLVAIVFFFEIAAAIAAYVFKNTLQQNVQKQMLRSIAAYDNDQSVQQLWNSTQAKLKCCGSTNYTDWEQSEKLLSTYSVPDSCCVIEAHDCGFYAQGETDISNIYQTGCADTIIKFGTDNMAAIGGTALGIAFIQLIGIILACCLAQAIRKDYEVL